MDSPYDINPAGYTIHSAVHEVRHVWSACCTPTPLPALRCRRKTGIRRSASNPLFVLSSLAYHAYEGVAEP
jgi:hypothetical protein